MTPADKGSEVPLNWKPPHAELNNAAMTAAAVAHEWEAGVGTPTPGPDGRVLYVFGQGMPVMVCAPLRVCAVELQPGEHLQSQPQIGDSRRWEITPVMSGSGLDQTPLLVVKPIEAGLETDLIIPTDRRTYVVRLISDPTGSSPGWRFSIPLMIGPSGQLSKRNRTRRREMRKRLRSKRERRMTGERQRGGGAANGRERFGQSVLRLQAQWRPCISSRPRSGRRPAHIPDLSQRWAFRELPTLLMLVNGKTELVNFRVDGTRYIVDRLFDKAILVVGVGKKQTRVTITRATPYSGAAGKGAK